MREFQMQLLHHFSKSDNKSNHHHLFSRWWSWNSLACSRGAWLERDATAENQYPTSWVTETQPRPLQLSTRPKDEELLLAACIDAMIFTGLWSKMETDYASGVLCVVLLCWLEGNRLEIDLRHFDTVALQHTATHCNTLQHTATHCNTL